MLLRRGHEKLNSLEKAARARSRLPDPALEPARCPSRAPHSNSNTNSDWTLGTARRVNLAQNLILKTCGPAECDILFFSTEHLTANSEMAAKQIATLEREIKEALKSMEETCETLKAKALSS